MSLNLTPFSSTDALVDSAGRPSMQFQAWLQNVLQQLNAEFGALEAAQLAQAAAETAQDAAVVAQAAADSAQTAADSAQTSAEDTAAAQILSASGTSGCTITATDGGGSATITISAHDRVYGDGSVVAVSGGSVTGLSYTTPYYIYYLDPTRAGGAVTYQASTDPNAAVQTGSVHAVGAAGTPAALGGPIAGNPVTPSGVVAP